ncbi:MAG: Na/Pi symporter, partial [Polyangiaceae bacterium]|nr:Na/Pi symporter [Polyangiaceae bacterium]
MPFAEAALVAIRLMGGLAFFVYGMKLVSEALQAIAGRRMRDLLYRLTRNRVAGVSVGAAMGFLIHSGATTVLLVTFIHAGMLTLAGSIPVMLGANVGTTLSMQLISFKVGNYALLAVAAGILLKLASSRSFLQHLGGVLLGFGLIFLGMDTMSSAVAPLKEAGLLGSAIALADARSALGFGVALLMSTVVTAIFQSSGATIGVLFALCAAGVFRDLAQVFPIILGAHVGTCSATLIGAVGTNIEARRSAISHLAF